MHFATASVAAGLLAVQPAVADFLIFSGYSNSMPDQQQTNVNMFFNESPDCDMGVNTPQMTQDFYNDASNGGIACDGCDRSKAPQDWEVTRFEINDTDGSYLAGPDGAVHITLYADEDNGGWGMFDSDMNKLGACDKPDPMQFLTCPDVLAADSTVGIIHCTSDTISSQN